MLDRRPMWAAGIAGGALALAVLAQAQVERREPQFVLGLVLFAIAGALLVAAGRLPARLSRCELHRPALLYMLSAAAWLTAILVRAEPEVRSPVAFTAWIVAIGSFLVACRELDRPGAGVRVREWRRTDYALCAGAVVVALLLRVVALERAPLTFNGDEGAMGLEALRVLRHEITDPFTTGWLSHPTLWFYLQAVSLRMFGDSVFGLRMLSALIGSATVGVTYVLARLLYGQRLAAVAAVLLASYHFHIHFSRMALNNIADPLFGTLILTLLAIAIRRKSRLFYGLTGVVLGGGLYFYHGTRLFPLLLLVMGGVHVLSRIRRWREWRPLAASVVPALILAGALVSAGPLLQTFIRSPGDFNARLVVEGVTPQWVAEEAQRTGRSQVGVMLHQLVRAALAFNVYPDTGPFYDNERPLLHGLAAALMVLGLLLAVTRWREWGSQALLAWFVLAVVLGGMLLKAPPKSPRYITLAPVVCLLIASAVERLAELVRAARPRWRAAPHLLAGVLVLIVAAVSVNGYFRDYLRREQIGGVNTHAANALARYLKLQPAGASVWFLGPPRMYYHGFSLLDFQVREVEAADVLDPISALEHVPAAAGPTVFAVLPERQGELELIRQRYPAGRLRALTWPLQPEPVMSVYEVAGD